MPTTSSVDGLAKTLEDGLAEVKNQERASGTHLLTFGGNFILAFAFFALGLTASVVATAMTNTHALIAGFVGVVALRLWSVIRDYEDARDQLSNLARDTRLAAMIVELTVAELEKRRQSGA